MNFAYTIFYLMFSHPIINLINFNRSIKVKLYGYFPSTATAMIIDLASGIPKDTIHTISNSLENIFSLICTMSGPCKIPFFSVATLRGFFEVSK